MRTLSSGVIESGSKPFSPSLTLSQFMDSESSTAEPTASSSQQSARGVITPGQTVLFRLPRGDIKSAVLKQNSYEVFLMGVRVIELIISGQFPSVKLGASMRMSSLGTLMDWHMRS